MLTQPEEAQPLRMSDGEFEKYRQEVDELYWAGDDGERLFLECSRARAQERALAERVRELVALARNYREAAAQEKAAWAEYDAAAAHLHALPFGEANAEERIELKLQQGTATRQQSVAARAKEETLAALLAHLGPDAGAGEKTDG